MSTRYAAGIATAYGSAVRGGYEGTYEQFCAALGDLANVLEGFENFSVSVNTLPEGSSATASYADGVLTLGIPKGDTGNGIASAKLNSNYTLTLTFTDGSSYTTPPIRGAQGEAGATGATGETGATGNGIASIAKTGTSGLVDTYTITYTDGNTFEFEVTNGQDGEVTEAELEQTLDTFAEGMHEAMAVGDAEQLMSTVFTTNSEPYLFRQTGGNSDREYLDKIVGGSLVWNQLAGLEASNYNNFSNVSFSASNQNISLTVTSDSSTLKAAKITTLVEGHKYFFSGNVISHDDSYNGYFGFFGSNNASKNVISYANPSDGNIYNVQSGDWFGLCLANASPSGTIGEYEKIQLIDLTAMFGTTIADYVYGLEQATAGSGIAWLKKYIDLDKYHAYSAPTLKYVEGLTSHDTVGFNQFNINALSSAGFMYQLAGSYISGLGQYVSFNVSDNKLIINRGTSDLGVFFCIGKCYKNVPMCVSLNCVNGLVYDIDARTDPPTLAPDNNKRFYRKTFSNGTTRINHTFTPSKDGYVYIEIYKMGAGSVAITETITNLNYNYSDKRNGSYEPYQKRSYALDSDLVLRGIPTLDSSNNLKYDGDIYEADGTITRRYGIIDLGTLTGWSGNMTGENAVEITHAITGKLGGRTNVICDKLETSAVASATDIAEYTVRGFPTSNYVAVKVPKSVAQDGAAVEAWIASNHPILVYELATPTTESADPYRQLQICDPNGTEQFVTTSEVPVGTETRYPENLRAKIEGLPWNLSMIAPIENGTTASKAYTTGQYFLHNNVFCKAKTNIASGATFTLNTNYEETDIATELYTALH